jgi:hypothetical protein
MNPMHTPPFLHVVAQTADALAPLAQQAAILSTDDPIAIVGAELHLAGVSAHSRIVMLAHGFLAEATMATTEDNGMASVVLDHTGPMGLPRGTWQILVRRLLTLPLAQGIVAPALSAKDLSDAIDPLPLPVILAPGPRFFQDTFTDTENTEDLLTAGARLGCDLVVDTMGGIRQVPVGFSDSTTFLVARFGGLDVSLLHTTFTRIA